MNFVQIIQFIAGYFAVAGLATIARLDYSIGPKIKKASKVKKGD